MAKITLKIVFRLKRFSHKICDGLLTGIIPEDKGPYALTPHTVQRIPTLGALFPRGGPVQDPVLTLGAILRGPRSHCQPSGWLGSCGRANMAHVMYARQTRPDSGLGLHAG